ncbi:MAG: hypothetical protein JNL21_07860, partial [Myxococcales bacterium]|nr:hypothetical protein [Myxococcales bacterium]
MRLSLLCASFAVAGCVSTGDHAPVEGAFEPSRVEVYHDPEVASEQAPPRTPVALPHLPLGPRPVPPAGARCVVYGRGSGLLDPESPVLVTTRRGTLPQASLQLFGAEFAWGVFPAPEKKLWAHVEDKSFLVDGFVEAGVVALVVRRPQSLLGSHVLLKENATVLPLRADEQGVAVTPGQEGAVIHGLESVVGHVGCEALVFDRLDSPTPAAGIPEGRETVFSRSAALSLFFDPGVPSPAKLGSERAPFVPPLEVKEKVPGWLRLGFETETAYFDFWAREEDVWKGAAWGWGDSLGRSFSGVNGIQLAREDATARRTTPIVVGLTPGAGASGVVSLREGAVVAAIDTREGFTAIAVSGEHAVRPPEGSWFWVRSDAL